MSGHNFVLFSRAILFENTMMGIHTRQFELNFHLARPPHPRVER